jgi:hypothetical protein
MITIKNIMINFYPKDYRSKVVTIKTLQEYIKEINGIDFHTMIDSGIEGASSFADEADKSVKDPSSKAENEIDGLISELRNDISEDFSEKFDHYVFLLDKNLELDDFPFRDWQMAFDSLNDKITFDHQEVLNKFEIIANTDKDFFLYNLATYLNVVKDEHLEVTGFFPHLNKLVNKYLPNANFTSILSGTNYSEFMRALKGEEIEVKPTSHLFFEYAKYLPLENLYIKKTQSRHLNKIYQVDFTGKYTESPPLSLGLNIPINILDMGEIYSAFSNSEVWKKISSHDGLKKTFAEQLGKIKDDFYRGHLIKNAEQFVLHLSQDDVELAENFFKSLDKLNYTSTKDKDKIQLDNALKLSLKFILEKEIPKSDIQVKKTKI